ncbi:MAG: chorismate mutase, partial [Clostridiales bacterium]|nr:chorismate mutase [Clostridiales bacterium]
MSIDDLRSKIDLIDDKIAAEYSERLRLVKSMGEEKKADGADVLNVERENKILERLTRGKDFKTAGYIKELYSIIFETSRRIQSEYLNFTIFDEIRRIVSSNMPPFPKKMKTACQGAKGAFSHIAAGKIFKDPDITFYDTFEDVFKAVERGECEVGILPIENSIAGSVNEIYDLMRRYKLYIIRSAKIKVEHSLIANKGVKLEDIKEVYSKEQALAQCGGFLKANS